MPADDRATQAAFSRITERVNAASAMISWRGAQMVQARAQGKLHVGFGVVSGTMRRSVHTEGPIGGGGVYRTKVGPSVVYARRFELGFFSTDVLGRVYMKRGEQPPDRLGSIARPFLRPAVDESRMQIRELGFREWGSAIRGG